MLLNLHVKNLALIEEVEVDFFDHLNILTGETGAGKSILIGSIEAALGGKVAKDLIRQDKEYALVELTFSVEEESVIEALKEMDITLDDGQITISRKIMPTRSVCRVNGETLNLTELRAVSTLLLDLCGQQENMTLKSEAKQLSLLDQFLGAEAISLVDDCKSLYKEYQKLKNEYEDYTANKEKRAREIDFLRYGVDEIREANLKIDEDIELEKKYKRQSHARQIIESMGNVSQMISGDAGANVSSLLSECIHSLSAVSDIDESTKSIYDQLNELDSLVADLNREINSYVGDLSFDDINFKELEERLDTINRLKTKYGSDIEMILKYADDKEAELEKLGDMDDYIKKLTKRYKDTEKQLNDKADKLSKLRKKAAKSMSESIKKALIDLNFLQVEFEIKLSELESVSSTGKDKACFMISTNPGLSLAPVTEVASGGELSRIMLAIKTVLADADDVETLIFDEIDTGVSGRTAQMVAEKLSDISLKRQIICITHLPQIAAMADTHYMIEKQMSKSSTKTTITRLYDDAAEKELARLLGGAKITDAVKDNAHEMRELARARKKGF
ncbi:MAG: DNA repair protein RecN [Lachnospiraceae bacterium]|nr:DNA repair protein RecN [Lachnospiraceae bacterium]